MRSLGRDLAKTKLIEHPELVAECIIAFAEFVDRENVIAGTDCGLRGVMRSLKFCATTRSGGQVLAKINSGPFKPNVRHIRQSQGGNESVPLIQQSFQSD